MNEPVDKPSATQPSIREKVITGSLWMGVWRWSGRILGIVSIVVLARLLERDEFGLVATGLAVIAFFDVIVLFGTESYLLKLSDPVRQDYDTAWTLRLLVVTAVALVIFGFADLIGETIGDSRLGPVLQILAVASALRGWANIGMVINQREFRYRRVAFVGLSQRVCGSAVTLILAYLTHSYWAMVVGEIVFRAVEIPLSYRAHQFRPRFRLQGAGRQWQFCKWIVASNLARFLQVRSDQLIVAKFFGLATIGIYSMAFRITSLITRELFNPAANPIYAGLSRKQDDAEEFSHALSLIFGAVAIIVFPGVVVLITLAEPVISVVLGMKWLEITLILPPIALTACSQLLIRPMTLAFTAKGSVRLIAAVGWAGAILSVTAVVIAANFGTIEEVAWSRTAVSVALLAAYFSFVSVRIGFSIADFTRAIYRPVIAAILTFAITSGIAATEWHNLYKILIGVIGGFGAFYGSVFGLWFASGRPEGSETTLTAITLEISKKVRKRLRTRREP